MGTADQKQPRRNWRWLAGGLLLLSGQALLIARPNLLESDRLLEQAPYLSTASRSTSHHVFQVTSPLSFYQRFGLNSPAIILHSQANLDSLQAGRAQANTIEQSGNLSSTDRNLQIDWFHSNSNPFGLQSPATMLDEDSPSGWMRRMFSMASLRYHFNRLVIQVDLAQLQRQFTGPYLAGDISFASIKMGYGLGTKQGIHYPVTMLVGISSRYTDYDHLEGEEISGSRSNNLYFTPGFAIGNRNISLEASLEVPIARYTPETENRLTGQMRANVGMKYRLK